LHHAIDDFGASTGGQFGQFFQGLVRSSGGMTVGAALPLQPYQNGSLANGMV
jgi:hypothetical protein